MRWNSSSVTAPRSRRSARRSRSSRGVGGRVGVAGPGRRGRGAVGGRRVGLGGGVAGAAAVVGLHLAVDLQLDGLGVADVGEAGLAVLAGRLEQQVAGADHPLEQRLGEGDVVDPLKGDLAAELGHHPGAEDQPLGGEHEVGGRPAQDPADHGGQQHGQADDADGHPGRLLEVAGRHDHPGRPDRDHHRDRQQHGHDQGQPVRPQVVDQLLVLGQQPLRERQPSLL